MAHTELTMNRIVQAGLADPTGVTGLVGGHQFVNDGVASFIRIANSPTTHSAVATVSLGAATPSGGSMVFRIAIFNKHYTTALIPYNQTKANIALAVLAATEDVTGNAMSTDFAAGTCTGAGTDLPTGPVTLTFGGAGTTGLATTPIVVTLDSTATTGGTYSVAMTTVGVGVGRVIFESPLVTSGIQNPNVTVPIPTGVSWFGPFTPSYFNQTTGSAIGEVYMDFDGQFANYVVTGFHVG